jgi:hypothetical protein
MNLPLRQKNASAGARVQKRIGRRLSGTKCILRVFVDKKRAAQTDLSGQGHADRQHAVNQVHK